MSTKKHRADGTGRTKGADGRPLPRLRKENEEVIAITCSDLHLSASPPPFRSAEKDWYATQKGYLNRLSELATKYKARIIYAGDIFDDGWRAHRCPPELINFAAEYLPEGFAIPGQHDLPHHQYEDIVKSAYWTLCRMGVLSNLPPGEAVALSGRDNPKIAWLYGFPWGSKVECPQTTGPKCINIAVIHACCWYGSFGYQGALPSNQINKWDKHLRGYNVAVFGDNHKGFNVFNRPGGRPNIINNGTFMVRKAEDLQNPPKVGLIYRDGSIAQVRLDISKDKYSDGVEDEPLIDKTKLDAEQLMNELEKTIGDGIDFAAALRRKIQSPRVKEAVGQLIQTCMEES